MIGSRCKFFLQESMRNVSHFFFFFSKLGQPFYNQRFVAIIYELINIMSLSIRLFEDYYKLQYSYLCTKPQLLKTATPSVNFVIHVNILINNNALTTRTFDSQLITGLATRFTKFWSLLEYEVSLNICDDSSHTFDMVLKCKIFELYAPTNCLLSLDLELSILTQENTIHLEDMSTNFNYLLASWYLFMETQAPFVFSLIGRQYAKSNIFWYRRVRRDVLGYDSMDLDRVLMLLEGKISYSFTVQQLLLQNVKLQSLLEATSPTSRKKASSAIKSYPVTLIQ
ncbi:conserved hypothetical protein [Candida dubliniensis CD36]|uniref:Uncharacterized protein n=1 Tax=Candida dubliniensis (strain CD36 / ATCC MYA-646 / CBS 7987 / NCPF 3949 / NRRL Y-17841) TaxID=573826 RepID=B9WIW6_CANDC|nr:conserved hypothetical protein [Candida dubliniensis CD36]CAX41184.1 conserved hypothetical protein [Candida dubliniensis CD36]